jgi:hypothetical protein
MRRPWTLIAWLVLVIAAARTQHAGSHLLAGAAAPVTELARALADLVSRMPRDDRRALARLLGHSLAAPSRAVIREDVLGLLAELCRHGEKITVQQYEHAREQRRVQGQHWPSHTTLSRRYGRPDDDHGDQWAKAVEAAQRLVWLGGAGRVPASYRHAPATKPYTRGDVTLAIRRFAWDHDDTFPTQWEYEEWARVTRLRATNAPRLPGLSQISALFGSWDRALDVAQREESDERARDRREQ